MGIDAVAQSRAAAAEEKSGEGRRRGKKPRQIKREDEKRKGRAWDGMAGSSQMGPSILPDVDQPCTV